MKKSSNSEFRMWHINIAVSTIVIGLMAALAVGCAKKEYPDPVRTSDQEYVSNLTIVVKGDPLDIKLNTNGPLKCETDTKDRAVIIKCKE